MANIKSKQKRILTNEKARVRNAAVKSRVRKAIRNARFAISNNDPKAEDLVRLAHKEINTSVSKGVFHKNNGARKNSRLDTYFNKNVSKAESKNEEVKVEASNINMDEGQKKQFHIVNNKETKTWDVKQVGTEGKVLASHKTQKEAYQSLDADFRSREDGEGGHIFVHKKDGKMSLEHSINVERVTHKKNVKVEEGQGVKKAEV